MDSPLGETRMSQALRRRPARFGADRRRRTRGAARRRSLVEVQWIALRPHGLHGLEAVLHHVAVELDAVAVRIEEVDAAGDVVLGVTEPLRLDHCGPSPGAPRRPPYFTALLPRGRNGRVPDSPPPPVQGPTPSEKGGAVQERATHDWHRVQECLHDETAALG